MKYAIDLPFFEWSNVIAAMNLDRWNSFSPAVQKTIMDVTIAFEPKMVSRQREMNAVEKIISNGQLSKNALVPRESLS